MADEIDFGGKTLKNATLDSSISGGAGDMRWLGTWNSGTTYSEKDVVLYDGLAYVAIASGSNNTPYNGSSYWTPVTTSNGNMKWIAEWNGSTYYYTNDVVQYNNGLYITSSNHSGQTPYSGSSYWTEILPPAGDMSWAGAWSSGTNYEAKDVVSYNGDLYIASSSSYSQYPYDGSSYWTKMTTFTTTWKGDYNTGTSYYTGDFVVYNNKLYKATNNNFNQNPDQTLYWSEVSPSVGMFWRGDWSSSNTYVENDVVIYNSNVYIAKNASPNSNQTPYDGSTYWTLLTVESSTWKSTWNNNTNYSTNDVVLYSGALYAANQSSYSQTPYSGSSYWTSLSGSGSSLPTGSSSSPHMVWNTLNSQWEAGSILPSGSISDGYVLTWDSMLNQWAAEAGGGGLYVSGSGTNSIQPASGPSNNASGAKSVVGGGQYNTASGNYSVVGGGNGNTASGTPGVAFVGGGQNNSASGYASVVGGGSSNTATANRSGVCAGQNNSASGNYSFVGGGYTNAASGIKSFVGGGHSNYASGDYSVIGGGNDNEANNSSAIGGGTSNTANGEYSTVSGGTSNTASGQRSVVGGGAENTASAYHSTVGGGWDNNASGDYSVIGGGQANNATGIYSTISGGQSNNASADYSTVSGGWNNTASGYYSTIAGGGGLYSPNIAIGNWSTVSGGRYNTASSDYSTVGGGANNTASGNYTAVGGGMSNTASDNKTVVCGGQSNNASGNYTAVGGGMSNTASSNYGTVSGGKSNTASGDYSFIGGGNANTASGIYSSVLCGQGNNTNNHGNAHIIGSNITAAADDTTFVNNLHIVGNAGFGGSLTFPDGTTQTTAAGGSGGKSLLVATSDSSAMMSVAGYLTYATGLNYYANGSVTSGETSMAGSPLGLSLEPGKWYKITVFLALDTGNTGETATFFIENGGSGTGYSAYGGFNSYADGGYVSWDSLADGGANVVSNMQSNTTYTFGAHEFLLFSGDQTYIVPRFNSVGGGLIGLKSGSYFIAEKLG